MSELCGASIHITGVVQGVGFRPFVYGLAVKLGLSGWVRNTSSGVDIEVDGTVEAIDSLVLSLKTDLPAMARIDALDIFHKSPRGFAGFEIISSEVVSGAFQPISPDVSICPDCLGELFDPSNRHFHYPFINCTNCGPRFTIIKDIPYDRSATTMATFEMCSDCAAEYSNPLDRRFHAQPVACPVCGPHVWLEDARGTRIADRDDALLAAREILSEGKIVAVKGLGGFHLACDATNEEAVAELRRRKLRVDKPFALMMADLAAVEKHCFINIAERKLLESRQRPIVLLPRRPESSIVQEVAPYQSHLGVMLPYAPIHYLLMMQDSDNRSSISDLSLVMTSGNISEEPIATTNDDARQHLTSLADFFLMNNRDIHVRCDDSVVRSFTELESVGNGLVKNNINPPIYFLRRSRGYAPDSIQLPFEVPSILATGSELKNTFCLTRQRYAFVSHHIGDMENYETLRSFEEGIAHFERLFRIQPEVIACDLHPDYLSSRYALQRSQQNMTPLFRVQHHHAHVAAGMVDNGLDGTRPVIGLAFDGTGLGEDGAIWGGEFLVADYAKYQRPFHIAYFPLPGGDAAIKRPARIALALLWSLGMDWDERLAPVQDFCLEERQALRVQLEKDLNTRQTSSLGRLFDAAAALVGVRQKVNYEAQAAIEFEAVLDSTESGAYHFDIGEGIVEVGEAFRGLLDDFYSGTAIPVIAARFHNGLAEVNKRVCCEIRRTERTNEVVLSGGVWQNLALLGRTIKYLRSEGFKVYLHHQIPANDGGLSLGQVMVGAARFTG